MPQPPTTRVTLLLRLRNVADGEAWQHFLELYGPVIYGFYRKRGLQDADATDLTQDVLEAVAFGVNRLHYDPERGTFRGWLFTLARNKLRDYLAKRKRRPQGSGGTSMLEVLAAVPDSNDISLEWEKAYQRRLFSLAAERVRRCVDKSTWQAFWLTAVERLPGKEVAQKLGMSVGAVYVAKSRVVARLREHVQQLDEEPNHD